MTCGIHPAFGNLSFSKHPSMRGIEGIEFRNVPSEIEISDGDDFAELGRVMKLKSFAKFILYYYIRNDRKSLLTN